MPVCAVITCWRSSITISYTRESITFHRFPADPLLKNQWVVAIQRLRMKPNKRSFICSIHFKDDCFEIIDGVCRLRPDAVPTLELSRPFIWTYDYDSEAPSDTDASGAVAVDGPSNTTQEDLHARILSELEGVLDENTDNYGSDSDAVNDAIDAAYISLEVFLRRRKKANIDAILKALYDGGFICYELERFLRCIGLENREIQVPKRRNRSLGSGHRKKPEYSPKLKVFALKMVCHSPEAYEFIRNTFKTRFPPTRVVNGWFNFDCRKGEFNSRITVFNGSGTVKSFHHFIKAIVTK